jgi:hypothetical protein
MKLNNLIWSGCSLSFGSGFIDESNHSDVVKWMDSKLIKSNIKTTDEAKKWVKNISFPNQLGNLLGVDITYNLSVHGYGVEPQLRKLLSFIINNSPSIDDTLIGFQIPNLSRIELIDNTMHPFKWLNMGSVLHSEHQGVGYTFFKENYNLTLHQIKMLFEIWKFKKIVSEMGYKTIFIEFACYDSIKSINYDCGVDINKLNNWEHEEVKFPNTTELIEYINVLSINEIFDTFKSEGINNDLHFSENGHTQISNYLYNFLTK